MTVELNAIVVQRIEISPGLVILRVAPDGWELPDFIPGQYAVLALPGSAPRCEASDVEDEPRDPDKLIKRAYSIASSSIHKEYMEFYITLLASGALSPRLLALAIGDHVWLGPKMKGVFTLTEVPEEKNVILLSTGTGLAPYMSMLRSELMDRNSRHIAIVHGARHSWDLGYRSELMTFDRLCPHSTYIPSISRPNEESVPWGGHQGHVQDLWQQGCIQEKWGFKPTPTNTHIFLCGNPGMIDSMTTILEAEGFTVHSKREPGQIHIERYW